jgi:3D (Asp-Asp-Asp) domain-containing protein
VEDTSANPVPPELDQPLGRFKFTYYWVAQESKRGPRKAELVDQKCRTIAKVSPRFKRRLMLEGSGRLRDGRLVNRAGRCKCGQTCFWVGGEDHKWGLGVAQRPLSPFRSIAVDTKLVDIGQVLYVRELDGLTMPGSGGEGGFVHDGCVIADDRGGGVKGKQLDFFAAQRAHYRGFFKRHKLTRVNVYEGGERCRFLLEGEKEAPTQRVAANQGSS